MPGHAQLATLLVSGLLGWIGAAQSAPAPVPNSPPPAAGPVTPGDEDFAAGRFAEAASRYERALAAQPDSVSDLAALARIRLYQHREAEAADLARRAVSRQPGNPLAEQVLKNVETRSLAFGSDAYRAEFTSATSMIDFVVTDPLPVVHVRVDGQPASFLIDTGAPDIALSPAFARKLGLTLTGGGGGVFAGGRQAQVRRTTVPDLQIGDIQFRSVPAVISPAELPGLHTDGIIGAGLLMHVLATIDYCHGKLVLAPPGTSAAFEARAAASGANVVPMWLVGDHFIFARGAINGVEGLFNIDTGLAGGGLVATKSTLDAAGIVLDESKAGSGQGGGGAVRFVPFRANAQLGALTRADVPGVYMSDGDPYGMFRFKVAGALSHSFFRKSRVTFDFDAMKLVTKDCGA